MSVADEGGDHEIAREGVRATGRVPGHRIDHRLEGVHTRSAMICGGTSLVLFLLSYASYSLARRSR